MTNKNKIGGYVQLNQQRRVVEATTRDQLWADKYYGAWQDDMSADDMAMPYVRAERQEADN